MEEKSKWLKITAEGNPFLRKLWICQQYYSNQYYKRPCDRCSVLTRGFQGLQQKAYPSIDLFELVSSRVCVCVCVCVSCSEYLTLCDPMDYSLPGSSVHGDFPGKNIGTGCHPILQGIFLTQGSNSGLLHCQVHSLPSEPPGKPSSFTL